LMEDYLMKPRLVELGALALSLVAAVAPRQPLSAQATQVGQDQVQLAFGYKCDDRFVVRNDGAQAVTIEYGVTGAERRSSLFLKGKDAVEISSAASDPLELWVNGKIVATERKGNVACAPEQTGSNGYDPARPVGDGSMGPVVVVRPLEPLEYSGYGAPGYYPPRVVYVADPGLAYGSAAVVVTPLFRNGAGFGGGVRVNPLGTGTRLNEAGRGEGFNAPRRVDDGGVDRPVPNHIEPRRPAPQSSSGWGSTPQGASSWRSAQQSPSSWRSGQQSAGSWRSPRQSTSTQRSSQQNGNSSRSSHKDSGGGRSRGAQSDHGSRSHHHR
jgi:hypothetical protein